MIAEEMLVNSEFYISFEGSASSDDVQLFKNIHINIAGGQWTCLLGTSGVGKSTILRLIAGLPTGVSFHGKISAKGMATSPEKDQLDLHNKICYMAQDDLLLPWLNVLDNVMLGARLRHEKANKDEAMALLERVSLVNHWHKKPFELSGGMRQRAAIVRTLMESRPVVLLDEPFSALDTKRKMEMHALFWELLADKTVLHVTHDPAEASRLANHIYVLTAQGLNVVHPPPKSPLRQHNDPQNIACQQALIDILTDHHG